MKERKNPFQWLINIWTVTITLLCNTPRIWELARFEFRLQYRASRLGMLWAILSPLTQIGVYWFTFGVGLRSGGMRDGYPYVVWLVCGVTAWSYLSKGILSGAGELRSKLGLISKIDIPPFLLLGSKELALLMEHLVLLLVMFALMASNGWRPDRYAINLAYYLFCTLCFSFAADMIFSALALAASDFRLFLGSIMRLMFFLSPVFWTPREDLPSPIYTALLNNPFSYIITGYRNSLLYHQNFWQRPIETAIFWSITLLFYLYGCQWQNSIHERLADFV